MDFAFLYFILFIFNLLLSSINIFDLNTFILNIFLLKINSYNKSQFKYKNNYYYWEMGPIPIKLLKIV